MIISINRNISLTTRSLACIISLDPAKFGIVSAIFALAHKIAHKTFIFYLIFSLTKLLNLAVKNSIKSMIKLTVCLRLHRGLQGDVVYLC